MSDVKRQSLHIDDPEYWHDVMCADLYAGDCTHLDPNFRVDLWMNRMADIQFTRVSGTGHNFTRSEKHVRHCGLDAFAVMIQLRGSLVTVQDRREVLIQPGEITCIDSTRPGQLKLIGESEHLVVRIPRMAILNSVGPTERFTAMELSKRTALGPMLVSFLQNLAPAFDVVSDDAAHRLSYNAMGLIMTALAEQASIDLGTSTWARSAMLYRAQELIKRRFRDSDLTVQTVATALKISVRYLQEIFQSTGLTPSQYIWDCRVHNSRADLENPYLFSLSVSEIALRNGFSDLTHFGRRFREAHGLPPKQFRLLQRARSKTGMSTG